MRHVLTICHCGKIKKPSNQEWLERNESISLFFKYLLKNNKDIDEIIVRIRKCNQCEQKKGGIKC